MAYEILVLADMIEAFDREQPKPGRETTAFIKRWRAKEMEMQHSSARHLSCAVQLINRNEIETIRRLKKFRDEQREINKGPYAKPSLVDCAEVT